MNPELAGAVPDRATTGERAAVEGVTPVVVARVVVVELVRRRRSGIGGVRIGGFFTDAEHLGQEADPRLVGRCSIRVEVEAGQIRRDVSCPDAVERPVISRVERVVQSPG